MKHKGSIMILVGLICVLGIVAAYKYHRFANEDPAFCSLCHLTQEGYNSHETSVHYTLTCQMCHKMPTMEGNRLLLTRYVKGETKVEQEHGRIRPWETCMDCHNPQAAQGSLTASKSYGHARHVFMKEIKCAACHTGQTHRMSVPPENCRSCHEDKLVHGMGTAGLYCLNCHTFGEESEELQTSRKCSNCHDELRFSEIMSSLDCHDCHKPHIKLELTTQDCLGSCHSSETRVGQHSLHMKLDKMECITCHRPHIWKITTKNASGLCDRCHRLRDPMAFIY